MKKGKIKNMDPCKQMNKSGLLRKISPLALFIMLFSLLPIGQIACSQEGNSIAPPAGLIGWWPGDGNANDIVGENHGILQNGAGFGTGLVDQAFSLDGVDDYVMVPHHPSLNFGSNDFTLDLWVNFRTTEGERILIEKFIETDDPATRVGWTLTKLEDNTMRFAGPGNWNLNLNFTPPSIPTDTWIQVAVTRNANTLTLYWDGESLGSYEVFDFNLDSPASLKFGHRGDPIDTPGSINGRGFYLTGLIDEVEIFNRALSDSEIKEIFNAGSAGKIKIIAQRMIKPVEGQITSPFGEREFPKPEFHPGIDIWNKDMEKLTVGVKSPALGKVLKVHREIISSAGKWVWIWHGDVIRLDGTITSNVSTRYLHLDSINVEEGDLVYPGAVVGIVGDTGKEFFEDFKMNPHLQFQVRQGLDQENFLDTTPINPKEFIKYEAPPEKLSIKGLSPIDLIITDPDGLIVSKEINELPEVAGYLEIGDDPTENLSGYDYVAIEERKMGDYFVEVVPEPQALPTDIYNLEATSAGTTTVLARNVQISEIPEISYIIRSTETAIEKIIPAKVRIEPETLSLASKGVFTAFIQIPKGFGATIQDINPNTITISGAVATQTTISRGTNTLIAKFDRQGLIGVQPGKEVELTLKGKLFDGTTIEGSDTIRVIKI